MIAVCRIEGRTKFGAANERKLLLDNDLCLIVTGSCD
jgi:hypothetical protein